MSHKAGLDNLNALDQEYTRRAYQLALRGSVRQPINFQAGKPSMHPKTKSIAQEGYHIMTINCMLLVGEIHDLNLLMTINCMLLVGEIHDLMLLMTINCMLLVGEIHDLMLLMTINCMLLVGDIHDLMLLMTINCMLLVGEIHDLMLLSCKVVFALQL